MSERLKGFLDAIRPYREILGIALAFLSGVAGTVVWIRASARSAVMDEIFLAKLAASVRPTCIFNSQQVIETGIGTDDYIEDIKVAPVPEIYGYEIIIKMKRHLHYAPLVAGVNVNLVPSSMERVGLRDWKIRVSPETTLRGILLADGEGTPATNVVHRFKLEILH